MSKVLNTGLSLSLISLLTRRPEDNSLRVGLLNNTDFRKTIKYRGGFVLSSYYDSTSPPVWSFNNPRKGLMSTCRYFGKYGDTEKKNKVTVEQ